MDEELRELAGHIVELAAQRATRLHGAKYGTRRRPLGARDVSAEDVAIEVHNLIIALDGGIPGLLDAVVPTLAAVHREHHETPRDPFTKES